MAVVGLDKFKEYFAGEEASYALIGGAACSLIFEEVGLEFRATKDLDMVLCVEVVDGSFATKLKAFLDAGGYQVRERNNGKREFYRFHKPKDPSFPYMIELFARRPGVLDLPDDAHIARMEAPDEALSLSAILLDEDYYQALLGAKRYIDGIPVLDETLLIPFKARAFVDLSERHEKGQTVKQDDIRKHRHDVVRLSQLLPRDAKVPVADKLKDDLRHYIDMVDKGGGLEPKDFKVNTTWDEVKALLSSVYEL